MVQLRIGLTNKKKLRVKRHYFYRAYKSYPINNILFNNPSFIPLEKEKELSDMQSKFISTASHEFITPLTAVLSSTERLKRYSLKWNEEKKNEHYTRILNSVEYLIKLFNDILTISKTETGVIHFKPETVHFCSHFRISDNIYLSLLIPYSNNAYTL